MYKVMIIDDEPWTIVDIEQTFTLSDMGFKIIDSFRSPLKALPAIAAKKPDLIITDIRMPEMSGLELIKKVQEQHITCEFIIVSGYSDFSYAKEAISYGVTGYCLKPLNPQETSMCLQRVKAALDKKQQNLAHTSYIDSTFDNMLNYINTHFSEKLTLKQLAAIFNMNPNYCCALFSKYLNQTFSSYLTEIRINEAKSLLQSTGYPLEKVASLVGYNDYFYFSKVFKKECSYSPKDYRKLFCNKKERES